MDLHAIEGLAGFPAHAGMDPRGTPCTSGRYAGFPAHAGMDPCPADRGRISPHGPVSAMVAPGFPRPRGDGPFDVASDQCSCGFPRPRGDGPSRTIGCLIPGGFPAHAGMDRQPRAAASCWGFPAHAGMDPVVMADAPGAGYAVSPPTRGWTRGSIRVHGMRRWFPRPRGDGPSTAYGTPRRLRRGFPRPRGDGPVILDHDRMADRLRFPRPRGDGPFAEDEWRVVRGFPAHAGMDPTWMRQRRPTGGGVSPPTRGWTAVIHEASSVPPRRFPRPRGDGPCRGRSASTARSVVSPPTRGWTPLR